MSFINDPVLNIIVVGFHHKKGCQVEHCYPELIPGSPSELPAAWRYLPALALPDGSHNYLSDTIFFSLPGLTEPAHTVYGVSCFRQIPVEQVAQKTEDMTRSSVQKSVCVICRAPLFGRLAIKMELVVRAWFLQGDFSQTKLLEDAFKHLNSCPVQIDQTLEGLSVQKIVENWRHKALLLFKLLLLRRKILIYGSPAGSLSATLLTLVSLLPQCLEQGLSQSANVVLSRPLSPVPIIVPEGKCTDVVDGNTIILNDALINGTNQFEEELSPKETGNMLEEKDRVSRQSFDDSLLSDVVDRQELSGGRDKCHSIGEKYKSQKPTDAQQSPTMARDMSVDGLYNLTGQIDQTECGFPLPLFEDGYICLPYLSLQYLDLLSDPSVQGFVVGASNVLFKQKRQLFDVLVELNEMRIETADLGLRRQLTLGTEDLRFADHVVRHASTQGDAWIRDQFASYLIYLMRTSLLPEGSREIESYNTQFMSAFKATPAYEKWLKATNNADIEAFVNLMPLHPFSGQLSVADMKLKFAHTMSTTEGGRKVTAAVASTGRAVASTSRAVGGALSHARGALSGWWSALTAPSSAPSTASENSLDDKLDVSDAADPSDAEDVLDHLHEDNRKTPNPDADPPDKVIDEQSTRVGKITVI
ncbi:late secretory pathway protein AVL9 homolog isoform X1 [Maniola hyperantus]|uniref:late secretory pathway protein AVL9 homolog isoform X1 n=2 Tax=Aphantopus hyperantus TaxID=2795564 RepID=UPI001568F330|nr:late secretory pathway protein AVL9 homolog [Maniola hyperantus]